MDGVCRGCGRTRDEIAGWSGMTPAQKQETNRKAAQRRERPPQEDIQWPT